MTQCPLCAKDTDPTHTPFCSARCKNLDLHHWLSEKYVIATDESPETIPTDGEDDET